MYADIDRRGLYSLFELSPFEKDALIEALERFDMILEDTIDLIEGNTFIRDQKAATKKMIHVLKHIQQ